MGIRFGLLILALLQTPAFAQSTATVSAPALAAPVTMTSQQSADVKSSSIRDMVYLNYFGIYHGPQLAHLDSPYAVDKAGNVNTKMGMYFDSEISTGYRFTPTVGAGLVVPFLLSPTIGQGIIMGDAGVSVFKKKAISNSNLNVSTNLIVQFPTAKLSRDRGMDLGLKTTPSVRYTIPSTRFTVGSWNEAKAYLGVEAKAKDNKSFKLFTAPYVNYQLTSDFSLNLQYEFEAHHYLSMAKSLDFKMYQTDIQPGFIYSVSHNFMINPFVQLFTGNNTTDNWALGAVVSASL